VVPLECGERYAKTLRNARLDVIDDAGHYVEMEKPEALAHLIGGFK
jgi:pimeloyl-ACP methyl ester carboxylesterase